MSNVLTTEREVGSYFSDLRTSGFKNPEQYICLRYEIFKWFYICSPLAGIMVLADAARGDGADH